MTRIFHKRGIEEFNFSRIWWASLLLKQGPKYDDIYNSRFMKSNFRFSDSKQQIWEDGSGNLQIWLGKLKSIIDPSVVHGRNPAQSRNWFPSIVPAHQVATFSFNDPQHPTEGARQSFPSTQSPTYLTLEEKKGDAVCSEWPSSRVVVDIFSDSLGPLRIVSLLMALGGELHRCRVKYSSLQGSFDIFSWRPRWSRYQLATDVVLGRCNSSHDSNDRFQNPRFSLQIGVLHTNGHLTPWRGE